MRKPPEVSEHEIYKTHLKKLRDRCNDYDGAHSYTRNINVFFDKFVKLSILVLSSLTTYFIASHNDTILEGELDLDKKLTLSTTLVSGINAIFNFSDKAEIHRAIIADYLRLKNEINNLKGFFLICIFIHNFYSISNTITIIRILRLIIFK